MRKKIKIDVAVVLGILSDGEVGEIVVIIITDRVQSDRIEGNRIKNAYKRLLNTIFLRVHLGTRISGAFECVCQSCDVMTFTDEGGHEPVQCVPTPLSLAACLRTL